ncbi:MAG: indole-3-glycerol phosphate synthase TrpC [Planctomycetota bacterium]
MPTSLDEILAHKRLEVEALKARLRRTGSTTVMRAMGHVRSFADAITADDMVIVPEVKKADPWRGVFNADLDARTLSLQLEEAGAVALALQTDERYFHGNTEDLYHVTRKTHVPVMVRDFVVDEAQLTDIKAKGGDAVVLTAGLVDEAALGRFVKFADYILLQTIIEVADAAEVEMAMKAGAQMIGVQNRDLRTQELQLKRSIDLRQRIPDDVLAVSVGGVNKVEDLAPLRDAGYDAVVVGELIMRASDPCAQYRTLQAAVAGG